MVVDFFVWWTVVCFFVKTFSTMLVDLSFGGWSAASRRRAAASLAHSRLNHQPAWRVVPPTANLSCSFCRLPTSLARSADCDLARRARRTRFATAGTRRGCAGAGLALSAAGQLTFADVIDNTTRAWSAACCRRRRRCRRCAVTATRRLAPASVLAARTVIAQVVTAVVAAVAVRWRRRRRDERR